MPKGKNIKRSNINFRQSKRSRSGNKSNVAFGHYQRMEPYGKS